MFQTNKGSSQIKAAIPYLTDQIRAFLVRSFCLSCQRGRKVPVKMANLEEEKYEHREQFEYWLSIHAKSDRSSVILTTEYDAIKRYL